MKKVLMTLCGIILSTGLAFATLINPTPTPPTAPTTNQLEADNHTLIQHLITKEYNRNINTFNHVYTLIWFNPKGLTPQQVMDGLGTDAGQVFILAAGLASYVNSINANTLPTKTPYSITINNDGTVTIGAVDSTCPAYTPTFTSGPRS